MTKMADPMPSPAPTAAAEANRAPHRRDRIGRYDYTHLGLVCVCGHTLGNHASGTPRACMGVLDPHGDVYETDCDCPDFTTRPVARKLKALGR